MGHFRGTVQGSRGEASRLGHQGLQTTCYGWQDGLWCGATRDDEDGDQFEVRLTGGSSGCHGDIVIARFNTIERIIYFPSIPMDTIRPTNKIEL